MNGTWFTCDARRGTTGVARETGSRIALAAAIGLACLLAGCDRVSDSKKSATAEPSQTNPANPAVAQQAGQGNAAGAQETEGPATGKVSAEPNLSDLVVSAGPVSSGGATVSTPPASRPPKTGNDKNGSSSAGNASGARDESGQPFRIETFHETFSDSSVRKRQWSMKIYEDGRRVNHGEFVQYYENGRTVNEKGSFVDGKRNGVWEFYHANGKLAKTGEYVDAKVDGVWKKYNENGALTREEAYSLGKKSGLWKVYAADGKRVLQELEYADDQLHGIHRQWYSNGQLHSETPYVEGRIHGIRKVWFPSGKLQSEVSFERGKMHGTATSWNEAGNVVDKKTFQHGVLAREP